jgi:predicted ester cyclase
MDTDEIRQLIEEAAATASEGFQEPAARERYVDFYDDSVVLHGYPPGIEGKDGATAFYNGLFEAVDGGHIDLQEVLVEGDTAAVRFRLTGKHAGELLGVPASGNDIDVTGQSFIRVRDGRIVERFQALDALSLMQQIGAIPAPA